MSAQAAVIGPQCRSTDPQGIYGGGGAVVFALAMRKVQAKIVRADDWAHASVRPGSKSVKPTSDPHSRWAPRFRAQAILAELLSRCEVAGSSIIHIDRRDGANTSRPPHRLFTAFGPGDGFDYSIQIDKVLRAAVEREDRLPEILSQADDFWLFFEGVSGLNAVVAPRTLELLNLAWDWAGFVTMRLKYQLAECRPVERSALVVPIIVTPGHGSMPSGHATVATLFSELLSLLLGYGPAHARRKQLDRLARRIAFNRVVAGVHFPMDSDVGYALGWTLARYFFALAGGGIELVAVEREVRPDSELLEDAAPVMPPVNSRFRKPVVTRVATLERMMSLAKVELASLRI